MGLDHFFRIIFYFKNLVNLEDNKEFFPLYFVAPVLRIDYAEENPEDDVALNELGGYWKDEEMQKYNLIVDEGGDALDVATQMLKDAGINNVK